MTNVNYDIVCKVIAESKEGLSIADVVRQTKLSRATVRIYVEKLVSEEKVSIRTIGKTKLLTLKKTGKENAKRGSIH